MLLAFRRRCAIICEKGAYVVDIFTPFVLSGQKDGFFCRQRIGGKAPFHRACPARSLAKLEFSQKLGVLGSQRISILMPMRAIAGSCRRARNDGMR